MTPADLAAQLAAVEAAVEAKLAAHQEAWSKLADVLQTGGMADPAFLTGQVEALVERLAAVEAERDNWMESARGYAENVEHYQGKLAAWEAAFRTRDPQEALRNMGTLITNGVGPILGEKRAAEARAEQWEKVFGTSDPQEAKQWSNEIRDALNEKLADFEHQGETVTLSVDAETYHRWSRLVGDWRAYHGEIAALETQVIQADARAECAEQERDTLRAALEKVVGEWGTLPWIDEALGR
jgi:hypothetical protein